MLTSGEHRTSDEVSFQLHKADRSSPRNLWILGTSSSLDNFKVMQYGHDVLRHKDIAGVQCHPHHGHQHRICAIVKETYLSQSVQKLKHSLSTTIHLWYSFTQCVSYSSSPYKELTVQKRGTCHYNILHGFQPVYLYQVKSAQLFSLLDSDENIG